MHKIANAPTDIQKSVGAKNLKPKKMKEILQQIASEFWLAGLAGWEYSQQHVDEQVDKFVDVISKKLEDFGYDMWCMGGGNPNCTTIKNETQKILTSL